MRPSAALLGGQRERPQKKAEETAQKKQNKLEVCAVAVRSVTAAIVDMVSKERAATASDTRENVSHRMLWEVEALLVIVELDAGRLAAVLRSLDAAELNTQLKVSRLAGKRPMFHFGRELFTPSGRVHDVLGGGFRFEREGDRAVIGEWLDMVGARNGDNMLHLANRVAGAELPQKTAVLVQLLARGVTFEAGNIDGEVPSRLDQPAFSEAFLRQLPAMRRAVEAERAAAAAEEAACRSTEAAAAALQKREFNRSQQKRLAEDRVAEARRAVEEEERRREYHASIDRMCALVSATAARDPIGAGAGVSQQSQPDSLRAVAVMLESAALALPCIWGK